MRQRSKEIILTIVLLSLICIRYFYFLPEPVSDFENAVGKNVIFTGVVDEFEDRRADNTRYTVKVNGQDFSVLVVSEDSKFHYGDEIRVEGMLEKPEGFTTDSGKEFNYERYLSVHNVFYLIQDMKIEKIGERGNPIRKILFFIRTKFQESLDNVLLPRDSGFVKGLLIGEKGGIEKTDREAFTRTGMIHVVALSGYNVMVVADAVIRFFSWFAIASVGYILAGISLILFVILAGAGSTAIRAGFMAVLALYARHTGRTYNALRALTIVSLIMLMVNPKIIFDVSFHLSVLATFGVITLPVKLVKYFKFITPRFGLRETTVTTLSAIIMVSPYIIYVMGTFSVIALFVNIFVLPLIPYTMFGGFVAGAFGLFSTLLAMPFSYLTHVMDLYIFRIIHFFSAIPFASIVIQSVSIFLIIGIYIVILYFVFKKQKSPL